MEGGRQRRKWRICWMPLCFSLLMCFTERVTAQIRYSTPEEVKTGSIVGNIAKDLGFDVSTLLDRRLRLVSGSYDALFELNPNNGVLSIHQKIDREEICDDRTSCSITLKLIVEKPLEIHYVEVEVTDVNDHSPSFIDKEQLIEISESTMPGEEFQLQAARDPDSGLNAVRFYKLSQSDHFELVFRENGGEGQMPVLKLRKSLDREQQKKHSLMLTAIDGGTPTRSGSITISVNVLDENDNRPKFSQELYTVTIQENAPVGAPVLKVNATDLDEGLNGNITFSFVKNLDKKVYNTFGLDKNTGDVTVKGDVDFETTDTFRAIILASDRGTPPKTSSCRVVIKVADINDNKPEIDITSLSDVVPENTKIGTVVSIISVTDKDSGINGKILCSTLDNVPFELKPSFKESMYSLVTSEQLDRERISYYKITIKATDLGQPPLSSFKTIDVQITDVNDNSPEFPQNPLELYLFENNFPGVSIFSVSALDKDENENAAITYHIVKSGEQTIASFLNINSETGVIHSLKNFDFETTKTFQFQVLATDSGTPPLSSNVTVIVFILDQNDNVPVILYPLRANGSAEGVEEIPRNVNAGHLVTKVRAYDADIGYNGWLLFSLQEVTDHSLFGLDRYTGQIRTLRPFTESDEAEHKLIILVKDNGNVSLSATATVIIKLVEPKESFAASDVTNAVKDVEENNAAFYLIITLGSVSFLFIISIIVLIVMQCSKSTDYSSKYLQDPSYDGTLCHSIQYRSGDKRYMLVGPRASIGSTIVPGSNGNTLVIPDRRNNAFKEIKYSIPEEGKEDIIVGNVAKDLHLDVHTLVNRRFRIVSGDKDGLFQVNQNNGVLHALKKIDREEVCDSSNPCVLHLKIALDSPLEIHSVVVEITDVNDNAPRFPDKQQRVEIAESTMPGARFQLQSARDPDVGVNSVRSYKLSKNEHFDLDIKDRDDEKVPFLVLQKALDRERRTKHELTLIAVDGGNPSSSGTLNVTVTVLDNNDNRPVFSQEVYTVHLQENVPIGTIVLKVNATDLDEGSNGDIVYSLGNNLNRKIYEAFELDAVSGEIRVKGEIDFENTDVHRLDVLASDKGTPPMTVNCRVTVKILDVNDNAPEIEVTSLSNIVPEDSKPGTVISLISVLDKDSGVNGKVICSLTSNIPFELKPSVQENMYSLTIKSYLDREEISQYDINLTATDLGQPALTAQKSFTVQISDVNDNSPEFSQNPIEIYVIENNTPGASIFFVTASDKDMNENAVISYKIIKESGERNNMHTFLSINSETGVIHALTSFDYEKTKTFHFHVLATDSGTPSLSSNVTVNVFILDQNDNVPVILYPVITNGSAEGVEEIPRNVNAGHLVTKVRAYDADIGYNGWLLFSLQEVSDHSLFGLDRYTGQIRTLRSFTGTDDAEHKLIILVKDNGNVSLSATATLLVKFVEPKEAFAVSDIKNAANHEEANDATFYLIITLGSVSFLFIMSIIVLIVMQCSKSTDYPSKYLHETNYDGTLCHSIQYRSGDKRYMLVGPRMSIGSTVVPGSDGNTLVLPERKRTLGEPDTDVKRQSRMNNGGQRRRWGYSWIAIGFTLLFFFGKQVSAQIKYHIPEEVKEGSVVGNIAKDFTFDVSTLVDRRLRIVSGTNSVFFQLNQNNGILSVFKTIDREEVCDSVALCIINLKIALENPLEIHYVVVEIADVNDHSPWFPEKEQHFEIAENTLTGARFELQSARDLDVGTNSIRTYALSKNSYFGLEMRDNIEEEKTPVLVLQKALDREQNEKHSLVLTAIDGGTPSRSGTLNITVRVLDINDNRPICSKDAYYVTLRENTPVGTSVVRINATDLDDGINGDIIYSFSKTIRRKVHDTFTLNGNTGEIQIKEPIDFEENEVYRLNIQASDKGQPPMTTDCRVIIKITDENDNIPEIDVTSLSNVIAEDSQPGTVVSLISVTDKDTGVNGRVICSISNDVPFELKSSVQENMYSLATKQLLDRERVSQYDIVIKATDLGQPPLSTFRTLTVQVSDFNDNIPEFNPNPLELYLMENNLPGPAIFSVTASDRDINENAAISYQVIRHTDQLGSSSRTINSDMATFLNVNPETGVISALKSFDFETIKTFQFHVLATDSGNPPLSSNVTVNVFILDQNDNVPVILYPVSANGTAEGVEEISRNVNPGHLVTKVRAYDADIGYNGWLLFSLQEVSDHSLFGLDRYTGQIRTLRPFTETDEAEHKLIILVKDNGNVSLSATATVIIKLVEPKESFAASDITNAVKDVEENNIAFYLIITLGSVSFLFIVSIIVLIVMQCSISTDYSSKYLQDANYDGTLCHSIQYRSGDKRYMLVGPRMSIGSDIHPASNRNTLLVPGRNSRDSNAVRL
ncbi:Protocadherin alpha-7 [Bagarius yarrelli]|uniref:Protocadherin alpha-7 n=1 Tax=Bagarius yarrelli TaxID=175774 RepID=A0A556TRP6_BAGYA|nr:Protocadherin alpha-7 [Bagarius yarrelli]